VYFVELIAVCITLVVLRSFLSGEHNKEVSAGEHLDLAPVEIAYLTGGGDTTFALSVLVFDMLHREVKFRINSTTELLLPSTASNNTFYESKLQGLIKSSLKNWGERTVDAAGLNVKKDPIGFIRRLPLLYRLLSAALKGTAQEVLKDPRNLRKYISKAGLMRILAEIGASGLKQQFADELHAELLAKGLLLDTKPRQKLAAIYTFCFVIAQIVFVSLLLLAIPNHTHALIIFAISAFTACSVKAAIGARSFIPLYEDLSEVLNHATRQNFRIAALQVFLHIVNLFLNGMSILVFLILFGLGSLVLYLTHTVNSAATYLMLISMMLAQYIAAGYLLEAYRLSLSECNSPLAISHLKLLKTRYRSSSSIDALKSLLLNSQYDAELSYLLAIYGIETLFFI
jgi:hypothetical protein